MNGIQTFFYALIGLTFFFSCKSRRSESADHTIAPSVVTEVLPHDSDDPAIWVHPEDPSLSLILGTDKEEGGGIYAFDLKGKIVRSVVPVDRPNNIDVEYGLPWGDTTLDIAVFTERYAEKIRVLKLPELVYIDNGGIPVFVGEQPEAFRAPMGVAVYKNPERGELSVIVGRKNGPTDGTYLWQYSLFVEKDTLKHQVIGKFGAYSGSGEIEAIMVDDARGLVHYSDEAYGIRVYKMTIEGFDTFGEYGKTEFTEDREGISLWPTNTGGWIVISDQQDHSFRVFDRNPSPEGTFSYIGRLPLQTVETDGCEIYADSLSNDFPKGIMVAMSEGGIFHYYDLRTLKNAILR